MHGVQPKAKAKPTTERADGAGAALHVVHPLVGIQRFDLEDAGQVQAEDDDDDAGNPGQDGT